MSTISRIRGAVLTTQIDVLNWSEAIGRIAEWAVDRESRYVCICNVHSVVTATREPGFRNVVNGADMATPDGAPVAWSLRRMGYAGQERINGPDLMWQYCKRAAGLGESIFLYGGTQETLNALQFRLSEAFPGLRIAGAYSPPFRPLTAKEEDEVVLHINASGANTVWVGLGCPKQETWMALHRGRINAVMIGVGAAFDYHALKLNRAPAWMQRSGLEWFHRFCSEPLRLWRRYLVTNTLFVFGMVGQLIRERLPR